MTFRVVAPTAELALLLAACGIGGAAPESAASSATPAHTAAPPATDSHAITHPSEPNYLAAPLITGIWR